MQKTIFIILGIVLGIVLASFFNPFTQVKEKKQLSSEKQAILDIIENKEQLIDRKISLDAVVRIRWACTERACTSYEEKCNACTGLFYLEATEDKYLELKIPEEDGLGCRATEDSNREIHSIECIGPQPNEKYNLKTTLKENSGDYYLELDGFTPLASPFPQTSSTT